MDYFLNENMGHHLIFGETTDKETLSLITLGFVALFSNIDYTTKTDCTINCY